MQVLRSVARIAVRLTQLAIRPSCMLPYKGLFFAGYEGFCRLVKRISSLAIDVGPCENLPLRYKNDMH